MSDKKKKTRRHNDAQSDAVAAPRSGDTIPKLTKEQTGKALADIRAAYQDLLFRAPDADGEAAYDRDLLNGDMTAAGMRANIMKSQEYKDKHPDGGVPPPASKVQPIHINGVRFETPSGIWKYRGLTAFTALQEWRAGHQAKLETYAAFSRTLGVTTWRVFGEWVVTNFKIVPDQKWYDDLKALTAWMNGRGIGLHYVCYTGQQEPSLALPHEQQQAHWTHVCEALAGFDSTLVEVNNEDWKNGKIASQFFKPSQILATRSAFQDGQPFTQAGPLMHFTTEHTPRDGEWPRKSKNMLETARTGTPHSGVPAIGGEPIGVADTVIAGKRTNSPDDCFDYFAVAELYSAGACLHGDLSQLQSCIVPTGRAMECCHAVRDAWAVGIPLDAASLGHYTRGGLTDCPIEHSDSKALRTFAMIQGAKATVVVVRPTADWHAVAAGGWRIVKQAGSRKTVVWLER